MAVDTLERRIKSLQNRGMDPKELRDFLVDTLDGLIEKMDTKKAEDEGRRKNEYIKEVEDIFHENHSKGSLGIPDVAALALLVCKKDYPEWTVEDMDEFMETIDEVVRMAAEMVGKDPMEMLKVQAEDFGKVLKEAMKSLGETAEKATARVAEKARDNKKALENQGKDDTEGKIGMPGLTFGAIPLANEGDLKKIKEFLDQFK